MTKTTMYIPFQRLSPQEPELAASINSSVARVISSGRYLLGPEVEEFEHKFAEYIGRKYCRAVGNGYDALHIALRAMGQSRRVETKWVICPSTAPLPTVQAIQNAGFFIDPLDLKKRDIGLREFTYMAVVLYGWRIDPTPFILEDMMSEWLIEDCAQAHGMKYKGKMLGTFGSVSAFSFYPTKNLGAMGDAGAILTDNEDIYNRCCRISQYGNSRNLFGVNSRMDEIQAAVLNCKLPYLDTWNKRRREIADIYIKELSGYVDLPQVDKNIEPIWHQFVIRHKRRDELRNFLEKHAIETMIHYPKIYVSDEITPLPIAKRLATRVLSIPVNQYLSDAEIEYIIDKIKEFK